MVGGINSGSFGPPSNYVGTLGAGGKKPPKWWYKLMKLRKRNEPFTIKSQHPGGSGNYVWGQPAS